MTTIFHVRVLSVDGPRLSLHLDHVYGWYPNRHMVSSRTLALHFLWEPLFGYVGAIRRYPSGRRVPKARAQRLTEASPLWHELAGRDDTDAPWNRENVARFISCVGVVGREHWYEMWTADDHEYWDTHERDALPEPQATFLIAVTDPRWLAHLTPGMEWDSTAYDHDTKITVDPSWRTPDVLALARGIDAERAFDRMPILADALQDAGCDADDLLAHLRDPAATHVRGCWALDLVLGNE